MADEDRHELAWAKLFTHMPARKSADGAVANLVRSGRKQPQRFRAGSSASTFSGFRTCPTPARAEGGGVSMTEFEFLVSVFGLLIGLTFIEIAIKFADAIDAH